MTGQAADTCRAIATGALGHDYAALGRWREAADFHRRTVVQSHRTGQTILEGLTLLGLGEALTEPGDTEEARSCLRRVLVLGDAADSSRLKAAQELLDTHSGE
ncbi:tetratricopeptide repeat protein [Streptomyces sp. NBC_01013]|uniref:tetratricopeptide repeat protein n=1 Tax=Streptomyces sp. NBC_01013 TaxID=2903718 RepID=UPI0038664369|nr:tetratricopeptide repeat protein [Streptomyces sp. NBC_01013]